MPVALTSFLQRLRPPYRLRSVYEHLLGTEVEVQIIADSQQRAEAAEAAALAELNRLAAILNRFDPNSELRQWLLHPGQRQSLSADLLCVLALAEQWRTITHGAFHPGADALGTLWQQATTTGQPPDSARLNAQVEQLGPAPWTLHGDGSVTLHATYPLGLNALAKGYIVDRMAEMAHAQYGVHGVLINAGGDLRTIGGQGLKVVVADHFTARDNAASVAQVSVHNGALATSGSAHRGFQVGTDWHSHVLDPRNGQPVDDVPGVTVTAPDCVTADALATALSVLDREAGLELVENTPNCAALIVQRNGSLLRSTRWPGANDPP